MSDIVKLDQAPHKDVDQLTVMVFGECGSGKSTLLTLLSQMYAKHFKGAKGEAPAEFQSGQSSTAVTTKVKVIRTGNLTLIDSPGINDPDKKRTDQQITIELVNTIRTIFASADQGISTITQCIMPDAGGRIKRTAIQSMVTMLLILTSIYKDANLEHHPRLCVIFNNVSKFQNPKKAAIQYYQQKSEDEGEEEAQKETKKSPSIQVTSDDYIQIFRDQLIQEVKELFGESYESDFIEQRIMKLFPKENFYFYQIKEDENELIREWKQIETFLEDNIMSPKYFIKLGSLEAVHL